MRRSLLLLTIAAAAVVALPAAPAAAATTRTASECLKTFDSNLDAYNRDRWADDVVATAVGQNGTTYTLRCGNELSGVIHIAHEDSTGSTHPINEDGSEDAALASCFRKTIESGERRGEPDDREQFVRHYGVSGGKSYAYTDTGGTVYTVYTNLGGRGNDWVACGR